MRAIRARSQLIVDERLYGVDHPIEIPIALATAGARVAIRRILIDPLDAAVGNRYHDRFGRALTGLLHRFVYTPRSRVARSRHPSRARREAQVSEERSVPGTR